MSPKSIAMVVALGVLGAVAVTAITTPTGFDTAGAYPEKTDFDGAFAEIQAALIRHPPAITAADREGLRLAVLKRITMEYVSE